MAKKQDIFARNGARPAAAPAPKIGQNAAGNMVRLGMAEIRNAASLNPQPAAEVQRSAQHQQPRPQPQQRQKGPSL
jgi:hypothetical protein